MAIIACGRPKTQAFLGSVLETLKNPKGKKNVDTLHYSPNQREEEHQDCKGQ